MVPVEKIQKALILIQEVLPKKKMTLRQLQKICGFLNFLGHCVVPGRAFTRRFYAHTTGLLKPHHHLTVTSEMRSDLQMWEKFLQHPSVFARPFMDYSATLTAEKIDMYSDASTSRDLGFGGISGNSWMYGAWGHEFIDECNPSIEYLELFTVVAMVVAWIHRHKNRRIILFCDNLSMVHMINTTSNKCKNCMVLI